MQYKRDIRCYLRCESSLRVSVLRVDPLFLKPAHELERGTIIAVSVNTIARARAHFARAHEQQANTVCKAARLSRSASGGTDYHVIEPVQLRRARARARSCRHAHSALQLLAVSGLAPHGIPEVARACHAACLGQPECMRCARSSAQLRCARCSRGPHVCAAAPPHFLSLSCRIK